MFWGQHRSRQRQTTVSLVKDLEVSERTVRGDLAFLRDRFHVPLEFNRQQDPITTLTLIGAYPLLLSAKVSYLP